MVSRTGPRMAQRKTPLAKKVTSSLLDRYCQPSSQTRTLTYPNIRGFGVISDLDSWIQIINGSSAPKSAYVNRLLLHLAADSDHPIMLQIGILETYGTGHTIVDSYGTPATSEENLLNGAISGASGINFHALTRYMKFRPQGSGDTVHHWLFRTVNLTKPVRKLLKYIGDHTNSNFNLVYFISSPSSQTMTLRYFLELDLLPYFGHEQTALFKG